jgi:hypothetical protein
MRFDSLRIGARFYHASSQRAACFEKKSNSSAYTLHPVTLERAKLEGYVSDVCGFSGCVDVHAFTEPDPHKRLTQQLNISLQTENDRERIEQGTKTLAKRCDAAPTCCSQTIISQKLHHATTQMRSKSDE